jgi:hypothetical protein
MQRPSAAVISVGKGLQPRVPERYVPAECWRCKIAGPDTVLILLLSLLQPSTAVNVLTCVITQPAVVAGASEKVILVTAPQPSVADAEPSAAVIAVEVDYNQAVTGEYDPAEMLEV